MFKTYLRNFASSYVDIKATTCKHSHFQCSASECRVFSILQKIPYSWQRTFFPSPFPKNPNYVKLKNSYWKNKGMGGAKAVAF